MSERFLSDLERGVGNISVARLLSVAEALDVPLAELVAPLDRARGERSIAFVGLRGAGKTTIGGRVAEKLGWPFLELDGEIEARAGLPIAQIFELHGEAYYRRLERQVVEALVASEGPRVLAAGGGVVNDEGTWAALKRGAKTVWLSAPPEAHYQRVLAQGDLRPMRNRPAAMAELSSLLEKRSQRYAQSDLTVDTHVLGIDGAADRVLEWVTSVT